tara:strand:- start:41 stop:1204 length:1164 start_codon:yes stop_codon:yes gene_type:complete
MQKAMTILGIESSCDDTAASVVHLSLATKTKDWQISSRISSAKILSSEIFSQSSLHENYGGVVPEIAARAHAENLDICVSLSLKNAELNASEIDLISVTSGPGLIGGLISGTMFAKGLSKSLGKPIIGVNHLAGHALSPRLSEFSLGNPALEFPYLVLLASGGHCQFLEVISPSKFRRLGGTIDDSPGEAFDKLAKLLGLGYPGGPLIENCAKKGKINRFNLPKPLFKAPTCNMSFSGLKAAAAREIEKNFQYSSEEKKAVFINDMSADFQKTISDIFAEKSKIAMTSFREKYYKNLTGLKFCVCGGVAANQSIRQCLENTSKKLGFEFFAPPIELCTDNGAMIASAGAEIFLERGCIERELEIRSRWPLDTESAPLIGSGKRGAKS